MSPKTTAAEAHGWAMVEILATFEIPKPLRIPPVAAIAPTTHCNEVRKATGHAAIRGLLGRLRNRDNASPFEHKTNKAAQVCVLDPIAKATTIVLPRQ
jgi:hypothetical protein